MGSACKRKGKKIEVIPYNDLCFSLIKTANDLIVACNTPDGILSKIKTCITRTINNYFKSLEYFVMKPYYTKFLSDLFKRVLVAIFTTLQYYITFS